MRVCFLCGCVRLSLSLSLPLSVCAYRVCVCTSSVRRDTVPPCFLHLLALDPPQGNRKCPMAVAVIVA